MTQFLGLLLDPSVDGRTGASNFAPEQQASFPPDVALAYAALVKAPPKPKFEQRWTVWGAGFGGSNTTNGNATIGSNNVTASDFGFAVGADYHYSPDTLLGFALAGAGTNWGLAQNLGGGRSDAFMVGGYGITHFGPAYLAADAAFANHWFSTSRTARWVISSPRASTAKATAHVLRPAIVMRCRSMAPLSASRPMRRCKANGSTPPPIMRRIIRVAALACLSAP
jgi:uncharacterized protein with beta-barrel porin domain